MATKPHETEAAGGAAKHGSHPLGEHKLHGSPESDEIRQLCRQMRIQDDLHEPVILEIQAMAADGTTEAQRGVLATRVGVAFGRVWPLHRYFEALGKADSDSKDVKLDPRFLLVLARELEANHKTLERKGMHIDLSTLVRALLERVFANPQSLEMSEAKKAVREDHGLGAAGVLYHAYHHDLAGAFVQADSLYGQSLSAKVRVEHVLGSLLVERLFRHDKLMPADRNSLYQKVFGYNVSADTGPTTDTTATITANTAFDPLWKLFINTFSAKGDEGPTPTSVIAHDTLEGCANDVYENLHLLMDGVATHLVKKLKQDLEETRRILTSDENPAVRALGVDRSKGEGLLADVLALANTSARSYLRQAHAGQEIFEILAGEGRSSCLNEETIKKLTHLALRWKRANDSINPPSTTAPARSPA